jgi:hypothetical protein
MWYNLLFTKKPIFITIILPLNKMVTYIMSSMSCWIMYLLHLLTRNSEPLTPPASKQCCGILLLPTNKGSAPLATRKQESETIFAGKQNTNTMYLFPAHQGVASSAVGKKGVAQSVVEKKDWHQLLSAQKLFAQQITYLNTLVQLCCFV